MYKYLSLVSASIAAILVFTQPISVNASLLQGFSDKQPHENYTRKKLGSAKELSEFFNEKNYKLGAVRKSKVVPRLFVEQIPKGMRKMEVHEKTSLFIRIMLTNVIKANEAIARDREILQGIISKTATGKELSSEQAAFLKQLEKEYKTEPGNQALLLSRVDTVPPSLAITQAIDESGWGTSRFAIEGNSLFGEHMPAHSSGKFIQAKGAKVKMAAFDTVLQATMAYMHNLNTSRAYHHLREMRAAMRKKQGGNSIDGKLLANALKHYSERGMEYVKNLHSIMRHYHLKELDHAQLDKSGETILIRFGWRLFN